MLKNGFFTFYYCRRSLQRFAVWEYVLLACFLFILLIVSFAIQRFCQLEAIPQVNMALGSCFLSYLVTTDKIDIKEPSFLCFLSWILCLQSQVKVLNVQLGFIFSVGVKFPCVYGDIQFFQHHCWKKSFSHFLWGEGLLSNIN